MAVMGVLAFDENKRKDHETIPSRFSLNKNQRSLLFYAICVQYTGQIVNSFGHGKCTFDCHPGNFKNYGSGNHVSTSSCMLRIEKLITYNTTWTFYTISLLHGYLFLMHVHK